MAIDLKYGRVTVEHGTIGEDEPVVVFRGRDALLDTMMVIYEALCKKAGSPQHHIDLIEESRGQINAWQAANLEQVRIPNSNSHAERIRT